MLSLTVLSAGAIAAGCLLAVKVSAWFGAGVNVAAAGWFLNRAYLLHEEVAPAEPTTMQRVLVYGVLVALFGTVVVGFTRSTKDLGPIAILGCAQLGFAGRGLYYGYISARGTGRIWRRERPKMYWFNVGTLALVGGIMLVAGTLALGGAPW